MSRGLQVVLALLRIATGISVLGPGLSKLVPAADIRRFAEQYVSATVLAKRFNLNGRVLACYLKGSGTPLLAVSIPEEGKGDALFLRKDIAAHLRIPSTRSPNA